MKIERWDTKEVIFELECNSWADLIKGAVKAKISFYRADLSYADLSYANLRSADLIYADLRSADLIYADLSYADLSYANLSYANLRSADLRSANLSYADLRSANLSYANLRYAIGNMKEIKSMQIDTYLISFNDDILNIGCESHTFKEWESFTDDRIAKMDKGALEWWIKWKEFIFQAIKLSSIEEKQ